jgi:hypothetical protein
VRDPEDGAAEEDGNTQSEISVDIKIFGNIPQFIIFMDQFKEIEGGKRSEYTTWIIGQSRYS